MAASAQAHQKRRDLLPNYIWVAEALCQKVWIFDQQLGMKDVYNRKIANVIVNEGKDKNLLVNAFLLGEGFATVYYSNNPLQKFLNVGKVQGEEGLESLAKKYNKGLWGKCN